MWKLSEIQISISIDKVVGNTTFYIHSRMYCPQLILTLAAEVRVRGGGHGQPLTEAACGPPAVETHVRGPQRMRSRTGTAASPKTPPQKTCQLSQSLLRVEWVNLRLFLWRNNTGYVRTPNNSHRKHLDKEYKLSMEWRGQKDQGKMMSNSMGHGFKNRLNSQHR